MDAPELAGPTKPAQRTGSGTHWKWLLLAVGLATLILVFRVCNGREFLARVLDQIASLGLWGPVLFVGAYVLSTVLFIPGSVLTLGAGAIFGVVWGSVYVSIGATLGATAAFLVGRYFARNWVTKKTAGNPNFAAIDGAVASEGWKIVALTRLSPVFPFTLLNYGFGLTRVRLRDYVLASWIGMIPGTVMYVYVGSLAGAGAQERSPAEWALYGVGLVATIAVTVFTTRLARRALAERTPATSPDS